MIIKPKISYISKILNTRVTIQALTSMSTKIHKKRQYVHKKAIVPAALPTAAQGRNRRRYRHDLVSVRQRPHSSVGRDPHQNRRCPKSPPALIPPPRPPRRSSHGRPPRPPHRRPPRPPHRPPHRPPPRPRPRPPHRPPPRHPRRPPRRPPPRPHRPPQRPLARALA